MSKKLTYEFVKKQFEKEGYVLLTKNYINNKQKLNFICPNGHDHYICWSDWQQGVRCGYCAGRYYDIDYIRQSFTEEGYGLLTTYYEGVNQYLEYECPNGHYNKITWLAWNKCHNRCPDCYGNKKHTYVFIKSEFEKEGYTLLTTEYINSTQKLKYMCPEGHIHSISYTNWRSGYRCYYCNGNVSPTIEFIRSEVIKEGYEVLSDKYENNRTHLDFKCPIGHRYKASWDSWQQGNRCKECYYIKASLNKIGEKHWNWKGGISCEPYCDVWADKEYKESIKERDGYMCLNPCCNYKNPSDLTIHHIDYNKKNCEPYNLITLCRSCNSKANGNRIWHKQWYIEILKKRGVYRCQNII